MESNGLAVHPSTPALKLACDTASHLNFFIWESGQHVYPLFHEDYLSRAIEYETFDVPKYYI